MKKFRTRPAISVIMPAYNAELFVARAIESILAQTFQNFELIVIDDNSTDLTLKIVEKYAKSDNRIRVISNRKNLDISNTLNKGIKYAKAELIARMDADDVSHEERFKLQYKFLKEHPKVAIVGSFMKLVDPNGNLIAERRYPVKPMEMKSVMFRYSPFAHPSVMYRKSVIDGFGRYNAEIACEDIDLWFKVGSKYDLANIPKFLLNYTVLESSYSYRKLRVIELDGLKVKINAIKHLGYKPSAYDILYNLVEYTTVWLMPPKIRIWLYIMLRNYKLI